jgi:hypothetical protein
VFAAAPVDDDFVELKPGAREKQGTGCMTHRKFTFKLTPVKCQLFSYPIARPPQIFLS